MSSARVSDGQDAPVGLLTFAKVTTGATGATGTSESVRADGVRAAQLSLDRPAVATSAAQR
jgi:hypothetical protein